MVSRSGCSSRLDPANEAAQGAEPKVLAFELDAAQPVFVWVLGTSDGLLGYPEDDWLDADFLSACVHPEDRFALSEFQTLCQTDAHAHSLIVRLMSATGAIICMRMVARQAGATATATTLRGYLIDTESTPAREQASDLAHQHEFLCLVVDRLSETSNSSISRATR